MEAGIVEIATSTIAAVAAIACAVIANGTRKKQDASAKDARDYREKREKLDVAKSKVLLSTMEGVTVLLHQAKGEQLNGNVEHALGAIQDAKDDLETVRSEIVAQQV